MPSTAAPALLGATSVTTEKANLSGTQTQITAYVYGTGTPDGSSPAIYRDDLVCAVVSGVSRKPTAEPGSRYCRAATPPGLNLVEYQYDRQGEVVADDRPERHRNTITRFDNLGRQVSDTATVLGHPAVRSATGTVRRIDTAYDCWATLRSRPATAARAAARPTSSIRLPTPTTASAS